MLAAAIEHLEVALKLAADAHVPRSQSNELKADIESKLDTAKKAKAAKAAAVKSHIIAQIRNDREWLHGCPEGVRRDTKSTYRYWRLSQNRCLPVGLRLMVNSAPSKDGKSSTLARMFTWSDSMVRHKPDGSS